ncbi:MAG: hypothetical protein ACREJC_21735 [Tepidisphaeraceae bacterium]
MLRVRQLFDQVDPLERAQDELVAQLRLYPELRKHLDWRYPPKRLSSARAR